MEQFAQSLSGKQKEIEEKNLELQQLKESLHNEKEQFESLNNKFN